MIAGLSGVNAAFRSMRSERSMVELVVRLAGLVQRFAADAVETEFGGPGQHQRTDLGVNAAFRSMRSERSMVELVVRLAGLVQRFAADAVETEFGGPGQHQRTAAAVAIDPLQRKRFQHRLAAAGADRECRELVGAFPRGILWGVSPRHLFFRWIGTGLGDRLEP